MSEKQKNTQSLGEENEKKSRLYEQLYNIAPDGMRIIDKHYNMINCNPAFAKLAGADSCESIIGLKCYDAFSGEFCHNDSCPLRQILKGKQERIQVQSIKNNKAGDKIPCVITASPFRDENGEIVGIVEDFQNVTDFLKAQDELKLKLETIRTQQETIYELSSPILEIWDGILALPVIGLVDSERSSVMTDQLLTAIINKMAKGVIIDITGIDVLDTKTADQFIKMAKSIRLLGAEAILTGISPSIAQTLTHIDVNLEGIVTLRSLRDGLMWFLADQDARSN